MYACTSFVLKAWKNWNGVPSPFQAEQYALATAVTPAYHPHAPGEPITSEDEKDDKALVDADAEQAKAAHAQTKFTWVVRRKGGRERVRKGERERERER